MTASDIQGPKGHPMFMKNVRVEHENKKLVHVVLMDARVESSCSQFCVGNVHNNSFIILSSSAIYRPPQQAVCWRLVVSFGLDEVQLAKWQACRRGRAVKWIHDWKKNAMNCLSLMSLCNAVGAWNQPSTRLVFGSRTFSRNDYYLTSRVTFSLTLQTCVSLQGLPQHHFRSNCLSAGLEITRTYKKIMDCHNCLLREWGNGQPFSGGILCRFSFQWGGLEESNGSLL